jgi:hypothetical protein
MVATRERELVELGLHERDPLELDRERALHVVQHDFHSPQGRCRCVGFDGGVAVWQRDST